MFVSLAMVWVAPEVDKRDIDDVGSFDITLHRLQCVLTQTARLLSEFVKFLTGSSGIHPLEGFVKLIDVLGRHPRVFDGVGELLIHFGIGIDSLTSGHY